MKETAVTFGRDTALIGVVTSPGVLHPKAPAVIFLSAGLLPRMGPNRLYARLARRLSNHGLLSLRFDRSGVGDSGTYGDGVTGIRSALREAQDAMDYVKRVHGVDRIVLAGLCGGAWDSLAVASRDPRVTGVILIGAFPYRTLGFCLRYYPRRVFRRESWVNVFAGRHPLWRAVRRRRASDSGAAPIVKVPSRDEAERQLGELSRRGVHICVINTGEEHNYPGQFAKIFPRLAYDRLQVEYFGKSDHTFTLAANQGRLLDCLTQWTVRLLAEVPASNDSRVTTVKRASRAVPQGLPLSH